jgi:hypothetical protein
MTVKKKKKVATKKTVLKKTKKKTKVKAKLKIKKNYLMMVLDESGSMAGIKPQAISAFNEQVATARESKGKLEVAVSLVKFSDETKVVFNNVNINKVEDLNEETYTPNGFTAMYDGVGKAFEILNAQPDINDPNVTVLVLVISDGLENASKLYNSSKVADLVKQSQATGRWTFTYAGANQDLTQVAASLNIPLGNVTSFQASAAGMSANNVLRSNSSRRLYKGYTTCDTLSVQNFYSPDPQDKDSTDNSTSK